MEHYPFVGYGFELYSVETLTDFLEMNGFEVSERIENAEGEQAVGDKLIALEGLIVRAKKAQTNKE